VNAEGRAAPGRPAPLTSAAAKQAEVISTVQRPAVRQELRVLLELRRPWPGCVCGCETRLPWYDDPACIRHRPLPDVGPCCRAEFDGQGRLRPCCRQGAA
jgi:hypothetical protein